jgi:hypothetical protein
MPPRFALRFESGERGGERLELSSGTLRVGRKSGNDLQLLDGSVSGNHAELRTDGSGCTVVDLGSTNGTRVGSERVHEKRLAHGDHLAFGNVRFTFLDASLENAPPAPGVKPALGSTAAAAAAAGEALRTISADQVARAGKRSPALALGLLVLVGAGAGLFFWLRPGSSKSGGGAALRPVEAQPGNLLSASYSFEAEARAWENDERAVAAFEPDTQARYSGAFGLAAELEPSAWALARSEPATASRARAVRLAGRVRADAGLAARLALEFSNSTGVCAPLLVCDAAAGEDWQARELGCAFPAVFDTVRAVVLARAGSAGGRVELDDVVLTTDAQAPAAGPKWGETELVLAGQPASSALLYRIDRALLGDLRATADGALAAERLALSGQALPTGLELQVSLPASARARLSFWIEREVAAGGLATLAKSSSQGAPTRASHQSEFVREGVVSLLAGAGREQIQIEFAAPVVLRGRPQDGRFSIEAELTAARVELQLSFAEELQAAQKLAARAAEAEAAGKLGEAGELWNRLEAELPFDPEFLERAQRERARLAQVGFAELQGLQKEAETARFFALPAVFRSALSSAAALEQRFAPSDSARSARELARTLEAELAALEAERGANERARLGQIAEVLAARGDVDLAARVRAALAQAGGGTPPAASGDGRP